MRNARWPLAAGLIAATTAACTEQYGYPGTSYNGHGYPSTAYNRGYYYNANTARLGPNGDYDRDGVPNRYDRDANGDGVPDRFQR